MHNTHSNNREELSKSGTSKLGITIKKAFILVTFINAEVAKIEASFLAFKAVNI